jgi:hypothetical protein
MPEKKSLVDQWLIELEPLIPQFGIAGVITRLLDPTETLGQRFAKNPLAPHHLGTLYERLLSLPTRDSPFKRPRKRSGTFFTPEIICRALAELALKPVIEERMRFYQGSVADALGSIRVLDPACGGGAMLIAVGDTLVSNLTTLAECDETSARQFVAERCLFGFDNDPTAIDICRWSLQIWSGRNPGSSLACRDTLLDVDRTMDGTFDVVIGNPPFANAIEGDVSTDCKAQLARLHPLLRGTADLAYYFLDRAHQLAAPGGTVGLVLPRAVLVAPSARKLRERLLTERPPLWMFAPSSPYFFAGANVHVVLLVLGRGGPCRGGVGHFTPAFELPCITVQDANWWSPLSTSRPSQASSTRVGDVFEVSASMTTAEAYALRPFLTEASTRGAVRLITTGLIDPGTCLWGTKTCRYLGQRWRKPSLRVTDLPEPLRKRVERHRRPKVLIAGLAVRLEAYLDQNGCDQGAVSTLTVMHPDDDLSELERLCAYLNSDEPTHQLHHELGALALGGGRITIGKAFVKSLPWDQPSKKRNRPT